MRSRVAGAMALSAILLAACDSGSEPAVQAPPPTPARAPIQVELPVSELVVGEDRLPIGLVQQNSPVRDATVTVRINRIGTGGPQLRAEVSAPFKGEGLEGGGLYVARAKLDRKGPWLAQVLARRPDGSTADVTRALNVVDTPRMPAVGQPAPQSKNLTARDVPDLSYIDTGQPPNDMHELSIADAVRTHRPALVVFATPAFCKSATCGPEIHAAQVVEPEFRDRGHLHPCRDLPRLQARPIEADALAHGAGVESSDRAVGLPDRLGRGDPAWCVPCRQELQLLASAALAHRDDRLALVAVNYKEDPRHVRAFADELHLRPAPYLDPLGRVSSAYRVGTDSLGLPVTVFITREGRIASYVPFALTEEGLNRELAKII